MKRRFRDLTAFRRDPLTFLKERGNESEGPLVRLALGLKPIYLVNTPELVKPLLNWSEEEICKGRFIRKLRPAFGKSFLLLSGKEHRRRREVVHACLARGAVLRQVPEMTAAIRQLAASLARQPSFDAHKITGPLTLRLICIALFGHRVLSDADELVLLEAVRLIEHELEQDMFRVLPRNPLSYLTRTRNYARAHAMMALVVQRVRAGAGMSNVLQALQGLGLSDSDIRDEILTMLLAGHHTTASAAAWLLYHLAVEEGLAEAVALESAAVTKDCGDIKPAALSSATVSLALVREVLRLYPSAFWFSREIKRNLEIAGYRLRRGTSLLFCPWQMHRHPRYWPEPDAFRLDRSYLSGAYIPFGAGPRTCVGMGVATLELQLLALEFAAAYHLVIGEPRPAPIPSASVTLVPPPIEIRMHAVSHRQGVRARSSLGAAVGAI